MVLLRRRLLWQQEVTEAGWLSYFEGTTAYPSQCPVKSVQFDSSQLYLQYTILPNLQLTASARLVGLGAWGSHTPLPPQPWDYRLSYFTSCCAKTPTKTNWGKERFLRLAGHSPSPEEAEAESRRQALKQRPWEVLGMSWGRASSESLLLSSPSQCSVPEIAKSERGKIASGLRFLRFQPVIRYTHLL